MDEKVKQSIKDFIERNGEEVVEEIVPSNHGNSTVLVLEKTVYSKTGRVLYVGSYLGDNPVLDHFFYDEDMNQLAFFGFTLESKLKFCDDKIVF